MRRIHVFKREFGHFGSRISRGGARAQLRRAVVARARVAERDFHCSNLRNLQQVDLAARGRPLRTLVETTYSFN